MRPLALLLALLASPARADGDAAWAAFREEVRAACEALVEAPADAVVVTEVNPFGSERYGVALVTVTASYGTDRLACVFDKATRRAELTAPFLPAP